MIQIFSALKLINMKNGFLIKNVFFVIFIVIIPLFVAGVIIKKFHASLVAGINKFNYNC